MSSSESAISGTEPARALVGAALLCGLLGLAYLIYKSVLNTAPEIDLKYIWAAGRLWAEGINPYTEIFATIGDRYLEGRPTNRLDDWLYPPNWWVISRPLAGFDLDTATLIWRGLNAALVCGAVALVIGAFRDALGAWWPVAAGLALGFAATMQATAQSLTMGQTSIVLAFGLSATVFGLMRGRLWVMVLGLALVALKPQVGLVVLATILAVPATRGAGLWALVVTGLLCIPSFLAVGAGATISGVIDTYLSYDGGIEVTSPANTTGLRHLVYVLSGVELSSVILSVITALVLFVALSLYQRRAEVQHLPLIQASLVILVPIGFVGLHGYDFIIVLPLVMVPFLTALPLWLRAVFAFGLVLIWRSSNVAEAIGWTYPGSLFHAGSLIDSTVSLGLVALFSLYLAGLARNRRVIA